MGQTPKIRPPEVPGDLREGLFNDKPVGPAGLIQIPAEAITRLHGLVLDLDPKLLRAGNPLFPPDRDPRRFLEAIRPVLDRHPLARHGEARSSGTGLHLIIRLDPPVEIRTAADQRRWSALVRAALSSLPSDPNAPGLTALTRPVGSVNSKNGGTVERLRPGQAVAPERVIAFVAEMAEAPFRAVAVPLLGSDRVEPCPACLAPGSSLGVLDRLGRCYCCGEVTLERLFDIVFAPPEADGSGTSRPGKPRAGKAPGTATAAAPKPPAVKGRRVG